MQIAIPIYPAFTALDAVGPYEVLQRLPGAEVVFCSERAEVVRTEQGMLGISADRTLAEVTSPDIVVVPGGAGTRAVLDPDGPYASWIADVHETTDWTTSVCSGSLLHAAAGVLDGVDATTHWGVRGELGERGADPVAERVVERGKVITAAGVSSGIDMALHLAGLIAGWNGNKLNARTHNLTARRPPCLCVRICFRVGIHAGPELHQDFSRDEWARICRLC